MLLPGFGEQGQRRLLGATALLLGCGGTRIMLSTPQGFGEVGKNSIPYFKLSGLEDFFAGAVSKGALVEREPHLIAKMPDHDLWIGFLKDPDGNLVGLMEEKAL
jgi:hypothetical protein